MWKEAVVTYFKVSQNSLGGIQYNHENIRVKNRTLYLQSTKQDGKPLDRDVSVHVVLHPDRAQLQMLMLHSCIDLSCFWETR
jgi:hypothetical protein